MGEDDRCCMETEHTSKTCGYTVTLTTYGTWLQGDKRGFVKNGNVLKPSEGLEQANKRKSKREQFKLKRWQREVVREAILEEAERIGEQILALSVWSNHVHVVVKEGGRAVGKVVSRLKSAAYYALKKRGCEGRVWTRGYDKRFCFDEKSLRERIRYVEAHGE